MDKILFEDAALISQAKVTIDGVDHTITEAEYSGGTDLNAATFNQLQDNVENAINKAVEKTVLFNNTTNTSSTITLSDSVANYECIEIFYKNNDHLYSSLKVHQPNNTKISLDSHYANGTAAYLKFARATISGTEITINGQTQVFIDGNVLTSSNGNFIYITRVVGYKEV